jgi:4-(gamma-glutamylamino)butanal dehydrogenase
MHDLITSADSRAIASSLDGADLESRLFQEEIFGSILSVTTFNSVSEATALANDTA